MKRGAIFFDSPYGNGDSPFPYGDASPRFYIEISVWKQGVISFDPHMETGIPHFHIGMHQSPFPYGDPCMETGSHLLLFPIWKWVFPISLWGCENLRFQMAIAVWKRGVVSLDSPCENCVHRFHMVIPKSIMWFPLWK
jgi:hypothetical protein